MVASRGFTSTTAPPSTASTPPPRVLVDDKQFTDEEHDALDKATLEAFPEPEDGSFWPSLLHYITNQDERLPRLTLEDAKQHLQLPAILKEAWHQRKFKEVRSWLFFGVQYLSRILSVRGFFITGGIFNDAYVLDPETLASADTVSDALSTMTISDPHVSTGPVQIDTRPADMHDTVDESGSSLFMTRDHEAIDQGTVTQDPSHLSLDKPNVQVSVALSRVSPDRDQFTDAVHKELDEFTLAAFKSDRKYNEEPSWPEVLFHITARDERLRTIDGKKVEELLSHPTIVGVLKEAWKKGEFKEVRKLEILWEKKDHTHFAHMHETVDESVKCSVEIAFRSEFLGDSKFLCEAVRDVFRPNNEHRYSNSFSILQSSGSGKSRLVNEMAKTLFTFPICVRADDPSGRMSFPPPDQSIRKFLVRYAKGEAEEDKVERQKAALCLLYGLFKLAHESLCHLQSAFSQWKREGEGVQVASFWRMHLMKECNREVLYDKAVKMAKDTVNSDIDAIVKQVIQMHMVLRKKALQMDGKSLGRRGDYPIVVYVDEAHEIEKLDGISSAFGHLKDIDVVGIFLSTTFSITRLAPSPDMINSDRVSGKMTFVPPFTELHLDPFARKYFMGPSKDLTLEKVRSIRVTASLGRPLWSAHLEASTRYPIKDLLTLAETKLTSAVNTRWQDLSPEGRSALLSVRILIHRTKSHAGRKLSGSLIASHMATVFMINGNRSLLLAGYPPEPFLAAAAVRNMPSDYHDLVAHLLTMIASDHVSRADRGELISRLLLTIAHDLARQDQLKRIAVKPSDLTIDSALEGHEPVPVIDFLRHFVGDDNWKTVADARPFNMATSDSDSRTLKDFLGEHAVVDFTCFGIAEDDIAFTYKGIVKALMQGAAIVCKPGEQMYDCIIPYVRDRHKAFTLNNLGLILVQDKNSVNSQSPILDPTKLPCKNLFPVLSVLHQPAQRRRVTTKAAPSMLPCRLHDEGEKINPIYEIHVDGTHLLQRADVNDLLMADDPLAHHREGSNLSKDAQAIVRQKRFYSIPAKDLKDAFDDGVQFIPS